MSRAPSWQSRHTIIGLLSVIALVLVGEVLRVTSFVTMPLAFAFFVAVLVHPIHTALDRRLPARLQWLGLVATMALIVAVVAFFIGAFWLAIHMISGQASQYVDRLESLWQSLEQWLRQHGLPTPQDSRQLGGLFSAVSGYVTQAIASIWSLIVGLVLIFFFVLLMRLETTLWRRKAEMALPDERVAGVLDTIGTIARRLRQYLLTRTLVSLISGVVEGFWLWLIGIDFAFVWGFLYFAMNYIPNIGSIVATIPPVLIALLQYGPWWALVVLAGLVTLEQFLGNYLGPRLQGRVLDVSPLVVLVSVIFWGWIWGPAGALLAVPLTVTVIIACAHVPALVPIAALLAQSTDLQSLHRKTHRHPS